MSVLSFDELAKLGANVDGDIGVRTGKAGGGAREQTPYKSPIEPNKAYAVEITAAVSKQSKNGFAQLELALSAVRADGTLVKVGRKWINLPHLTEAQRNLKGTEESAKFMKRNGETLHSILRAVDTQNFTVFASIDKTTNEWKYLDTNGVELSELERRTRGVSIGNAVKAIAALLAEGAEPPVDLVGVRLYMVEVPANNGGQPFTNFYSQAPDSREVGSL